MTAVSRDQFEIVGNEVRHIPTGAFFTLGGSTSDWGQANLLLPNGDYFARKDVLRLAAQILREMAMNSARDK